ncbi:hypothetical protein BKA61DRAFT_581325 [Leptodontidium sp. MPI-SDFR-AT-0119]|nr:hypothetical protein BKA61DRAFT_581325 [Leptodontidium sp. MPI-SDFR-AT-0119]
MSDSNKRTLFNSNWSVESSTTRAASPVTLKEGNTLAFAYGYLTDDYGILIIESDKDNDPVIRTKFEAVGLEKMDYIFKCQDRVQELQRRVMNTEENARFSLISKAEYALTNREEVKALNEDFKALRQDINKLRDTLEGSIGYLYKRITVQFKILEKRRSVEDSTTNNDIATPAITTISPPSAAQSSPRWQDTLLRATKASSANRNAASYANWSTIASLGAFVQSSKRYAAKPAVEAAPKNSVVSRPRAASTSTRYQQPKDTGSLSVTGEKHGVRPIKEVIASIIAKHFTQPLQNKKEEVRALKRRVREQEEKIAEMNELTRWGSKERDNLQHGHQGAQYTLNEEKKALESVKWTENRYSNILLLENTASDTGDENDGSEDSEEESDKGVQLQPTKRRRLNR